MVKGDPEGSNSRRAQTGVRNSLASSSYIKAICVRPHTFGVSKEFDGTSR